MTDQTATALLELGRVAARQHGVPDDQPIEMTMCPDRDYSWCGLEDDYVEVNEEELA